MAKGAMKAKKEPRKPKKEAKKPRGRGEGAAAARPGDPRQGKIGRTT